MMLDMHLVDGLIVQALAEDIGSGDITTWTTVDPSTTVTGDFIAKRGDCTLRPAGGIPRL